MPIVPLPDNAPCVRERNLLRKAVPVGKAALVMNASLLPPVSLRVSPEIKPE